MKVLFATTNPAKIKKYSAELEKRGVEVLTLKDLEININVAEDGKNAVENACQKAKVYHDASKMVTIGMDNTLFLDGVSEEKQPGTHVRRVNGKELNDDEMIEYYINLVKEYGEKLTAKWVYGIAVYNGEKLRTYSWEKDSFYFVTEPCIERNPGYPLDSISIVPKFNKYLVQLTADEKGMQNDKSSTEDVVEFIMNTLEEMMK